MSSSTTCIYASTSSDGASGFKYLCVNATGVADAADISMATSTDVEGLNKVTDTLWILICGFMVFWMQAGFAMLESGSVRPKNTNNILFKNLMDAAVGGIAFYLLGFPFAIGRNQNIASGDTRNDIEFIGASNFALALYDQDDSPFYLFFFHWTFASAAATIVSGAVAERCRVEGYLTYTFVLTSFVYPVVAHWVWSPSGFLSAFYSDNDGERFLKENGFLDFAGSGVVHMVGGYSALIAAIAIGPRKGFFGARDNVKAQFKGSNELLCSLGVSILWFGWYGFNCGSTLAAGTGGAIYVAGRVAVNTTLAASSAAITTTIYSKLSQGYYDLAFCLNGLLAGLVSITAGCAVVHPWSAIVIGVVGSFFYLGASATVKMMKVDDPLDAFAVHGASGTWGCLAVGMFATRVNILRAYGFDNNALKSGNQFRNQLIGILCIMAWSLGTASLIFFPLQWAGILRVSPRAEKLGLDVAEHGVPFQHNKEIVDVKLHRKNHSEANPFGNFENPCGSPGDRITPSQSEAARPASVVRGGSSKMAVNISSGVEIALSSRNPNKRKEQKKVEAGSEERHV